MYDTASILNALKNILISAHFKNQQLLALHENASWKTQSGEPIMKNANDKRVDINALDIPFERCMLNFNHSSSSSMGNRL